MKRLLLSLPLLVSAGIIPAGLGAAEPAAPAPPSIARYVAVDHVCAWPMLVTLRDGTIGAIIPNRPGRGQMEGDIECWASRDGERGEKRGHPAPNDPRTVRMNIATGLARNGDLLVLCSGWTDEEQPERLGKVEGRKAPCCTGLSRSPSSARRQRRSLRFRFRPKPPVPQYHPR